MLAFVPKAYELVAVFIVAPLPNAIELASNLATCVLFCLKTNDCASVVPKKLVPAVVPALPVVDH